MNKINARVRKGALPRKSHSKKPSMTYLAFGHVEGILSPQLEREFARRFNTDPEARKEVARFIRQEEMLREVFRRRAARGER